MPWVSSLLNAATLRRRAEPDFGVDRERRQLLGLLLRTAHELGDLAHHSSRKRDQVARGQPVRRAVGVVRCLPERRG